jgi:cellulose synthase (UDP-forming)
MRAERAAGSSPFAAVVDAPVLQSTQFLPTQREPFVRRWAARAPALCGLALCAAYLYWRAFVVLPAHPTVWAWSLLLFEAFPVCSLAFRCWLYWSIDMAEPPPPTVHHTDRTVALLIPTYNEPAEVLLPALSAAAALQPAHQTWVLDDGHRPWVRDLATELGIGYFTRAGNDRAKAGNLNAALDHLSGRGDIDIIAILDCDFVALPGFLSETLGYFDDPEIALVQTPQWFYNQDSFEHMGSEDPLAEGDAFHQVILRAKDRRNGVFWCGTCALLRVDALREVGGIAGQTVTEDLETTIHLLRRGWKSRFHPVPLSCGLAPQSASQYLVQRKRWATGGFQVLRSAQLLTNRDLSLQQRFEFVSSILWWFGAVLLPLYLIVPPLVALSGVEFIDAPLGTYLAVFAVYLLIRTLAAVRLSRGFVRMLPFGSLQLIRVGAIWSAMAEAFFTRSIAFETTPKGRQNEDDNARPAVPVPAALWLLMVAVFGLFAWLLWQLARSGGDFGGTGLGGSLVAAGWLTLLAVIVASALVRVRAEQYGHDRRDSYRMPLSVLCRVEGDGLRTIGVIEEASFSGATVRLAGDAHDIPDRFTLSIEPGQADIEVPVRVVRRGAAVSGAAVLHTCFESLAMQERAKLTLLMFHGTGATVGKGSDARPLPVG